MFAHRQQVGDVAIAVTDRHGGASTGVFGSLNLGDHVGDEPSAVAENRGRVMSALGFASDRLVLARQVHGRRVAVVDGPWAGEAPEADALVTSARGLVLGVLVADCTPVVIAAPGEGVLGVAHAGRRGMADGVCESLVASLRRLGASRLVARVGPAICARCYPVPLSLREEVAAREPVTRSVDRFGAPSIDVVAGVLSQLAGLCEEVRLIDGCSFERDDLFSYRRRRTTGRYALLAWLTQ